MAIYKVTYCSMTARYGPNYIDADSEWEAKRKFAGTAFSGGEMSLISAVRVSDAELKRALRNH